MAQFLTLSLCLLGAVAPVANADLIEERQLSGLINSLLTGFGGVQKSAVSGGFTSEASLATPTSLPVTLTTHAAAVTSISLPTDLSTSGDTSLLTSVPSSITITLPIVPITLTLPANGPKKTIPTSLSTTLTSTDGVVETTLAVAHGISVSTLPIHLAPSESSTIPTTFPTTVPTTFKTSARKTKTLKKPSQHHTGTTKSEGTVIGPLETRTGTGAVAAASNVQSTTGAADSTLTFIKSAATPTTMTSAKDHMTLPFGLPGLISKLVTGLVTSTPGLSHHTSPTGTLPAVSPTKASQINHAAGDKSSTTTATTGKTTLATITLPTGVLPLGLI